MSKRKILVIARAIQDLKWLEVCEWRSWWQGSWDQFGPPWVSGRPHVGPMYLAIWGVNGIIYGVATIALIVSCAIAARVRVGWLLWAGGWATDGTQDLPHQDSGKGHTHLGHPGYFREPHWKSMGVLEITRVTLELWQALELIDVLEEYGNPNGVLNTQPDVWYHRITRGLNKVSTSLTQFRAIIGITKRMQECYV